MKLETLVQVLGGSEVREAGAAAKMVQTRRSDGDGLRWHLRASGGDTA
jgi:hypothetical protein